MLTRKNCRIGLPVDGPFELIAVYDDGSGMDESGLADLWHIGHSKKRTEEFARRRKRKQIGKFGIGKLATQVLAHRVTYLTRTKRGVLGTSIDFREFKTDPQGGGQPIELQVMELPSTDAGLSFLARACDSLDIKTSDLRKTPTWTIVLLEDLKLKKDKIKTGKLKWILSTAMPLGADFSLFLNNERIVSSKSQYDLVAQFNIGDLPDTRIDTLGERTNHKWGKKQNHIYCDILPSGISGTVKVTQKSLEGGKSEDISRSNGFFIRVRGRLINEEDAHFGISPTPAHKIWSRFRADLNIDDLDAAIKASRESVGDSQEREVVQHALKEIANEARQRYEDHEKELEKREKTEKRT